jgi:hypothetical protein
MAKEQANEALIQLRKEYIERFNENIINLAMGRYLGGWTGEDEPMWGIIVRTDLGLRFHHFPHEGWMAAMFRVGSHGKAPKEKILFIPNDNIISVEFQTENSWWKKIFFNKQPLIVVKYRGECGVGGESGDEKTLLVETDPKGGSGIVK